MKSFITKLLSVFLLILTFVAVSQISKADLQTNVCYMVLSSVVTPCPVDANGSVITAPSGNPAALTSTSTGTTITSGGTYQVALAVNSGVVRKGCLVQNNGTHNMYIFFKNADTATNAKSIILAAGQTISCAVSGSNGVIQNEIDIDGTTADAFSVVLSK